MFEKKFLSTPETSEHIDSLLKQGVLLSVGYHNTYYIYGTSKNVLFVVSSYKSGNHDTLYDISLSNVSGFKKIKQDQDFNKQIYDFVDLNYNKETEIHDKNLRNFDVDEATNMLKQTKGLSSIAGNKKYVESLVQSMIAHRCPMDNINREFYYMDNKNGFGNRNESDLPVAFNALRHNSVLTLYITPRKKIWNFVSDKHVHLFDQMNDESKQIFDKVKIALQNQKTK